MELSSTSRISSSSSKAQTVILEEEMERLLESEVRTDQKKKYSGFFYIQELTRAVVDHIKSEQDEAYQHSNTKKEGAHRILSPKEELLITDGF